MLSWFDSDYKYAIQICNSYEFKFEGDGKDLMTLPKEDRGQRGREWRSSDRVRLEGFRNETNTMRR